VVQLYTLIVGPLNIKKFEKKELVYCRLFFPFLGNLGDPLHFIFPSGEMFYCGKGTSFGLKDWAGFV